MPGMDNVETAWAAGFYEGEGSASVVQRKRGGTPYLNASITSTDFDVLEKWQRTVGFGKIYPVRYRHHAGIQRTKTAHRWSSGSIVRLIPLLKALRPHLSQRRQERIDIIVSILD